jgi:uncharacterized protein (TIGR03000 family)
MALRSLCLAAVAAFAAAIFPLSAEAAPRHGGGFHGGGGGHGAYVGGRGFASSGYRPYYGGWGYGYRGGRGFAYYGYYPRYRGWGYGVWAYPYYGSYAWYPSDAWSPGYTLGYYDYSPDALYPPPGTYESGYYPPDAGAGDTTAAPIADNCAHLTVRVRPEAQVWFGDYQTQQTGDARSFVSPPLMPGQDYTYEVHARWMENGRQVERQRKITVRANMAATVDLTSLQAGDRPGGR